MNLKNHINLSLGYFIVAAVLGVVLRSFHSIDIPVNYKYIVHTHSHIALLGWVYLGLTTLLYQLFLIKQELELLYRRIFWVTQLTLVGMLLSFPVQGYALFSIIFSTLFLLVSYWFTWFFVKHVPLYLKQTYAYKCVKVALFYMVISSLGPWVLGAIMNTLGADSIWYRMAIYFYLHFQYNGWMILALFGIYVAVLERHNIQISKVTFNSIFRSINIGIVLSFFLSALWTKPHFILYVLGGLGALMQIFAFAILLKRGLGYGGRLNAIYSPLQRSLLFVLTLVLVIKMALQLLTTLPYFSNLAATILDFTIGYLHLTFLGIVTIGLFLFLNYFKLLLIPKRAYYFYTIGFLTTEVLIFAKGIAAWQRLPLFVGYFELLTLASLLIAFALTMLLVANLRDKAN